MAAFERRKYYVLYVEPDTWVLGYYAKIENAQKCINWQVKGGSEPHEMCICTFDDEMKKFKSVDDSRIFDVPLSCDPYTKLSYAEALELHGINPKLMTD